MRPPLYPLPNESLVVELDPYRKTAALKRHTDWGMFPAAAPEGFTVPDGYNLVEWPEGFEIPVSCLPFARDGECLNSAGPRPVLGCACSHCEGLRAH
jgi:hypothetical protein